MWCFFAGDITLTEGKVFKYTIKSSESVCNFKMLFCKSVTANLIAFAVATAKGTEVVPLRIPDSCPPPYIIGSISMNFLMQVIPSLLNRVFYEKRS